MHGHPGHIAFLVVFLGAAHLDFPRMDADPDLDAQHAHRFNHGVAAGQRGTRAGERRNEAVPGGVDFTAAEPLDLMADDGVVVVEQVAPPVVAELRGALRRTDDVGEHDRGQHAFGIAATPHAGDELFDLVEHGGGIAHPVQGVLAGELDQACPGDVFREVAAVLNRAESPAVAMQDECRCGDAWQRVAHIGMPDGGDDRSGHAR